MSLSIRQYDSFVLKVNKILVTHLNSNKNCKRVGVAVWKLLKYSTAVKIVRRK